MILLKSFSLIKSPIKGCIISLANSLYSRFFNLSREYAYIEESISNFPKSNELILIAKEVGFERIEYKTLFCGQMGILILGK